MPAIDKFKQIFKIVTNRAGEQWLERAPAWTGNYAGVVNTDKPGFIYVRVDDQVVTVFNRVAALEPNIPIYVGRHKDQPHLWQVISNREVWSVPGDGAKVPHHHEQHEETGPDRLNLSWKQILPRSVRVKDSAGFIVRVFGDPDFTVNGYVLIPTQDLDLSSEVPSTGAVFVAVESDDDGALSLNPGTGFASPGIGTAAHFPVPDVGKYTRALVLLFEGQTALLDEHIIVPKPPSFNPTAFSTSVHSHFNDAEGDPEDVSLLASADGTSTYAARRDHLHRLVFPELVMEDGVTFPPVPVTNEDGTDWIYDY